MIRETLATEAATLTRIAFTAKRYWQYPEEWIKLWSDELTVSKGYIRSNEVFSAVVGDMVVGWYALRFSEEACELDYLWVLPENMGNGIGATMMHHAKGLFSNSEAGIMTVISDPNAEGFYLNMGFEKVGMHPTTPEGRFIPILTFSREML